MDNGTLAVGAAFVGGSSLRRRVTALFAVLALVLAMFALIQHFDASPAGASVAATASVDGNAAQIDIRQFVCPILISIRNAFANTFFGGFVTPILNAIIAAFGCSPSP